MLTQNVQPVATSLAAAIVPPATPTTIKANGPFTMTVTALNAQGQTATTFSGTALVTLLSVFRGRRHPLGSGHCHV